MTQVVYEEAESMHRLAAILGVSYEQLLNKRSSLKEPLLWPSSVGKGPLALTSAQAEEVSALGIDGVGVLPLLADMMGKQLVGSGLDIYRKRSQTLVGRLPHRG